MKPMSLRVLCDENVPGAVTRSLRAWGYDVAVPEAGTPDPQIGRRAQKERRAIITFDRDFEDVRRFPPEEYYGILRINIEPPLQQTVVNALSVVLDEYAPADIAGHLFIVEAGGRTRRQPR